MRKTLIGAAAIALGLLAFTAPAQAAVTKHTNLDGWTATAGGKFELVEDGVKLTTIANEDKVTWKANFKRALVEVTTLQYETEKLVGDANEMALPAYHLYVDVDNDTDIDTTLIFEPYWQGPSGSVKKPTATTTTWDVDAGYFWSSKTTEDGKLLAGAGGPPFYTLDDVRELYPNAKVLAYGVGQGSYNTNTVARVNHVKFNAQTNNWTLPAEPTESPSPDPKPTESQSPSPKPTESKSPSPSPSASKTSVPAPSESTAPTPSESASTPVGAQLPLTGQGGGVNVSLIATLTGIAMIAAGAVTLLVLRRRRDDEAEFTA